MDKVLRKMLQNDVIIKHQDGTKNAAGECNFGSPITYKGKVEFRETVVKDSSGKEVISKTRTFFDQDVVVSVNDLVTLPSGEENPVIGIIIKYNEKGNADHKVVYS